MLNGRDEELRISPTTRDAVLDAARVLGYAPDMAARRLRGRRAQPDPELTIAVVMPLDDRLAAIGQHARGIQRKLAAMQVRAELLVSAFPAGRLCDLSAFHGPPPFHGAIIANTTPEDDAFLDASSTFGFPFVLVHRYSRHSYVHVDGRRDADQIIEHLARLGHRQIGVVRMDVASSGNDDRYRGYREGLRARRLPYDPCAEAVGASSPEGGYRATAQLLARSRPTAIVVLNDILALGALRAAQEAGLAVPEDLSIVGYEGSEFAAFTTPPLTTVHVPIDAMVARALEILIALIRHQVAGPVQEMFASEMIVRDSTGPAPAMARLPDVWGPGGREIVAVGKK